MPTQVFEWMFFFFFFFSESYRRCIFFSLSIDISLDGYWVYFHRSRWKAQGMASARTASGRSQGSLVLIARTHWSARSMSHTDLIWLIWSDLLYIERIYSKHALLMFNSLLREPFWPYYPFWTPSFIRGHLPNNSDNAIGSGTFRSHLIPV